MNKKTLRIAGWALGLSMVAAGIGAAVGASQKAPVEAKAAEVPGATATLTITRSDFTDTGDYGAWSSWTATTSGGTSVSGQAEIYGTTKTSMQFNKGNGYELAAFFNTNPIPGAITKIEAKTASGTNRAWNAYVCSTAYSASEGTLTAGNNKTTVGSAVTVTTSRTTIGTSTAGYSYFCLQENVNKASMLAEIRITYTVPEEAIDDWELSTGSLSVTKNPSNLTYYTDDTEEDIDKSGAVIKANYWSASDHSATKQVDVTKDVIWSLDLENEKIDLSYTDAESDTQTGAIDITVVDGPRPLVDILEYSGSTTTTMTSGSNNASLVGLDTEDWYVDSDKNGTNNQVGLNKDGTVRLYKDTSDGNGTKLTVSAIGAKTITDITIYISQEADHEVYKVVNDTPSKVTATSGETYAINASEFYVIDADLSNQFFMSKINIGFDYVASFKKAQAFETSYVRKDVSYSDGSKGTNCLTWYDEAIDAYNDNEIMSDEARVWFASRDEFANARARLIAWAEANRATISFNAVTGAISYSAATVSKISDTSINSSNPLIITVAASVGLLTTGGIFLISRRRRE